MTQSSVRYSLNELKPKKEKILSRNAEAVVYSGRYLDRDVVLKQRIPKKYRHPRLDQNIRNARLMREVKVLILAKKNGVNVPFVFYLDKQDSTIVLEKIHGRLLKDLIEMGDDPTDLASKCGVQVAKLHNLHIIHGDLTTSNVIIERETDQPFLIDFGLAVFSNHIEEKAVDINVFLRTLQSTHPKVWEIAWDRFLNEYLENATDGHRILKRMRKIDERVRYKSH